MIQVQRCLFHLVIEELGLRNIGERRGRYANNQIQIKSVYRGVILEKGRDGIFDVLGEVEGSEPFVGQIVLEALDLIVDPITKTVIPNPSRYAYDRDSHGNDAADIRLRFAPPKLLKQLLMSADRYPPLRPSKMKVGGMKNEFSC